MTPIHSIVARGAGLGLVALVSAGCAAGSGASDGLRSPQGDQQCLLVSQDLVPIDPAALVQTDAVEGWLEEWATRAEDEDLGEFHAVWSLNTTAPEPDEDEEERAPQATGKEDAAPPRPGPPDAFLIESSLTPSQATALTELVRRARILDDAEPGLPSRTRLEAMRDSSGQLRLTPMVSTHCRPALEDPRRVTTELIRAARGARATGSTVTTNLFVDVDGRVGDVRFEEVTPGFEGRIALTEALMQARFHPALIDGHPLAVWVQLPVNLRPPGR